MYVYTKENIIIIIYINNFLYIVLLKDKVIIIQAKL